MRAVFWVWLGGGIGAVCRYLLGQAIAQRVSTIFPWGTWTINVTGCLILGCFGTLAVTKATVIPPELRLAVAVGFVGAYTTFSTFGFETIKLLQDGAWLIAGAYVASSLVVGLLAVYAGVVLARVLA